MKGFIDARVRLKGVFFYIFDLFADSIASRSLFFFSIFVFFFFI